MKKDYEYKADVNEKKNVYVLDRSRETPYETRKIKVPEGLKDLSEYAYEFKKPTP